MRYRGLFTYGASIAKLRETSLLPWEDVLSTSDFFTDAADAAMEYDKLSTKLVALYFGKGNENLASRALQKIAIEEKTELPESSITPTEILTNEGLSLAQITEKSDRIDELKDKEIQGLEVPTICIRVIKDLYEKSRERREKELSKQNKKSDQQQEKPEEPYFTLDDVRAYIAIGLTKKEEKKAE